MSADAGYRRRGQSQYPSPNEDDDDFTTDTQINSSRFLSTSTATTVMDEISDRRRLINDVHHAPVTNDVHHASMSLRDQLRGDWSNVALLTLLYVLQGIPLGLCSAVPMILQNRHISYKQQAVFSFVNWPFSLKLLWAPLVDSIYFTSMGRRKSWLVPTQYLIGIFMYVLYMTADSLFGIGTDDPPKVYTITAVFFALCFLAATQDIAVDGWALTMLSRRNVGYASTCNCVGQTAGYFLGYVVFLALESADFCNQYLRSNPESEGMTTLPDFLYFWSFVYLITTTLVWIFKKERPPTVDIEDDDSHSNCGIVDTFRVLMRIIKLPAMQMLIMFLLTMKMGFAAPDAVTMLKLGDYGVPKDKLALLAIPLMPLQIILPVIISKYTAGPRPLDVLIRAYPFRLMFGLIYPLLVWMTPSMQTSPGEYPYYFYGIVMVLYAMHQVALYSMFVAIMGFFAKISDPSIGGTYMTLLNTLSNLGGNWPVTVALYFIDPLTMRRCVNGAQEVAGKSCDTEYQLKACTLAGGRCDTVIDGYYVECIISIGIGFLWLLWGRQQVRRMQSVSQSAWRTPPNR